MDFITTAIEKIKGYKSYGILLVMLIIHFLGGEGIISPDTAENYQGMLTLALGGSLTAKANRFIETMNSTGNDG